MLTDGVFRDVCLTSRPRLAVCAESHVGIASGGVLAELCAILSVTYVQNFVVLSNHVFNGRALPSCKKD